MNFVVLAAAAATAASSAAFNLNCSGVAETYMPAQGVHTSEPYSRTYRIDLARRKWCAGECKATFDLAEVGATAIMIEEKAIDTPREHEDLSRGISRETGEEFGHLTTGVGEYETTILWKGACEKASFTGFPEFETKF